MTLIYKSDKIDRVLEKPRLCEGGREEGRKRGRERGERERERESKREIHEHYS